MSDINPILHNRFCSVALTWTVTEQRCTGILTNRQLSTFYNYRKSCSNKLSFCSNRINYWLVLNSDCYGCTSSRQILKHIFYHYTACLNEMGSFKLTQEMIVYFSLLLYQMKILSNIVENTKFNN